VYHLAKFLFSISFTRAYSHTSSSYDLIAG